MVNDKIYPIKIVENKTGLTMHVIRAWEKRYGAIHPHRTDTNRRLYSNRDILKLQILKEATSLGFKIGAIANLELEDLKELIGKEKNTGDDEISVLSTHSDIIEYKKYIDSFVQGVPSLNANILNSILDDASIVMNTHDLLEKVIAPIIYEVGEKWRSGEIRVSHEHLASSVIRTKLIEIRKANETKIDTPGILVCTPSGNIHELGALLIAALAAVDGWKVLYLGADMPYEEIISVVLNKDINVVGISLVYPQSDPKIASELKSLMTHLPSNINVLVGGRAAISYKAVLEPLGAKIITDMSVFKDQLILLETEFLR
jgi:methanogenic corrinoid protein MtbC1